jgi:hypothetical protein
VLNGIFQSCGTAVGHLHPPINLPVGIPSERCASTPIPLIRTPMVMPSAWPVTWQAVRSIRTFGV